MPYGPYKTVKLAVGPKKRKFVGTCKNIVELVK
jgi:hypothetical protein